MNKVYRVQFLTSTGGVDFTVGSTNLVRPPVVGGQSIDFKSFRAESRPWNIDVLEDASSTAPFFTQQLVSTTGRMRRMGQRVRAQVSTDGGSSFKTIGGGRVQNVALGADRQDYDYRVTVQHERRVERTKKIWTDVTRDDSKLRAGTTIIPVGIYGTYADFEIPRSKIPEVIVKSGNIVQLFASAAVVGNAVLSQKVALQPDIVDLIRSDLKKKLSLTTNSTVGNFDTLRAQIDGTDREIIAVSLHGFSFGLFPLTQDRILSFIDALNLAPDVTGFNVAVVWPGATGGATVDDVFLHMPTHEPTRRMPLHVGGEKGIHPFALVKQIYDEIGVSYSSTRMTELIQDSDFQKMRFQIEAPERAEDFLTREIYHPLGVIPLLNSNGEIAPRKIQMPQNVNSTSLTEYTSTNASIYPEWSYVGRDMITKLSYTYTHEQLASESDLQALNFINAQLDSGFKNNGVRTLEKTIEHTRTPAGSTDRPEFDVDVSLKGYHRLGHTIFIPLSTGSFRIPGASDVAEALSDEIFDRFADGPIRGTLVPVSTANSPAEGDFVRITIPFYPSGRTRGNTRIVQVISRVEEPAGPVLEWLDAGPDNQPLSIPSLSLAKSTADPKNTVVATVGSLSTEADVGWQLQTALSTSTVKPSSTKEWTWTLSDSSTGAFDLVGFPSGRRVFGRIRQRAPGRIRSDWSTGDISSTLEALTAPSSVSITNASGGVAKVNVTLGSTDRDTEILHSESTSCTSTKARVALLGIGETSYFLEGITKGSSNCVGARHMDLYGGRSALTTTTFVASTSNPSAPNADIGTVTLGSTC